MGLPYPKDLPDAWGTIKALEGQIKFLKSELEEWKLAAGESPHSKYVDLVMALHKKSMPFKSKNKWDVSNLGACRLLVALAIMPKGCRERIVILEMVQNLSIKHINKEPQIKIVDVYLNRARNLIKQMAAPGEIITHWGRGYSISDDLRAWVLSFADGGA